MPPPPDMSGSQQHITPKEELKKSGELEVDEYTFILDSCLKKKHREEPTVLSFIESFVRCKSIEQASNESCIHQSLGYKYRHRRDIATTIQKLIDRSAIKYGIDSTEIFERAKEIVDFDPIHVQNPDGTWKNNLHDIIPEARRCIKKMKVKNLWGETEDINGMKSKIIIGEVIEFEFYDRLKGVELTGKEKNMFKNTTVVQHDVTKDMKSVLLASNERANKAIEHINRPTDIIVEAEVVKKD